MNWIDVNETPIPLKELDNIEVSSDGETVDDSISYMSDRTCMLAGSAGGYGYFGEGWGSNGSNGCDKGLIAEPPSHWRYKTK